MGLLAAGAALVSPLHTRADSHEIFVHPGESIQAAVDRARPGDTVKVLAGTYNQQVNITTDDITLKGEGADDTVIMPPSSGGAKSGTAVAGNCDAAEGQTGICVAIPPISEGGTVNGVVEGVTVKSLSVTGFAGAGLFLFGTDGAKVEDVQAQSDGFYGIFFDSSTNGVVRHNTTSGNNEAGIYYGDSPDADAWITDNTSRNNLGSGIFFRDSKEGHIGGNKVQGNCEGIFVLNTGYGQGLANTSDVTVSDNDADKNNAGCVGREGRPSLSGMGILVAGASNTTVVDNSVEGNNAGTNATLGTAGVILFSTTFLGGTDESNNSVSDNHLDDNSTDLFWDGKGSGNHFSDNECDTSTPSGLC